MTVSAPVAPRRAPEFSESSGAGRRASARATWWRDPNRWVDIAIVVACCVFVFMKLEPRYLLKNTTPAGGDMGAHVWWPAYLRDHLLPWRLSGWTNDFYAGFPAGQYYFPVPALLIVLLDVVMPYNVAFKLVTALGPIALPVGAYVFARGLRAKHPVAPAMAVGATAFLFFVGDPGLTETGKTIQFNQHIMGGNLASNLAGEFSFTIALAAAFLFLGVYAAALRTGRHRGAAAALFAATVMSHLVVGVFAVVAAIIVWLFHHPIRNVTRALTIGGVGAAITAVWALPLFATFSYTTDMRYEALTNFSDYLFPSYIWDPAGWQPWRWGGYILVTLAIVSSVVFVRRATFTMVAVIGASGLMFRFWTDLGLKVWNLRLLSFWYLGIYLLSAVGLAELVRTVVWGAQRFARVGPRLVTRAVVGAITIALAVGVLVGVNRTLQPGTGPGHTASFLPYWAQWNYSGYEQVTNPTNGSYVAPCTSQGTIQPSTSEGGQSPAGAAIGTVTPGDAASITRSATKAPATTTTTVVQCEYAKTIALAKAYPEYHKLIRTINALPPGRLLWEGAGSLDRYGTPLALMLVPYWTHGRISSMEGVYFEASATTPYHFEAVAALVAGGNASNPERGIPYRTQDDFSLGVQYLQVLGVNYFAAHAEATKQLADADPRLRLVATSPDLDGQAPEAWNIYRVRDAALVEPLANQPVIATGVVPGPSGWEQQVGVPWFWSPRQLDRVVTASGLSSWRSAAGSAALRLPVTTVRGPTAHVSRIHQSETSVSFHVDRVGVPVVVKVSYFPNWVAHGASGPFRATPNFMVVVPTSHDVRLDYASTPAEWTGRLLTLGGLGGFGFLVWADRRRRYHRRPVTETERDAAAPPADTSAGIPDQRPGGASDPSPAEPTAPPPSRPLPPASA